MMHSLNRTADGRWQPAPRRRWLTAALVAALLAVFAARRASAADDPAKPVSRPNFIVIMADDLGAKELACYGNREHLTPHLDRLAEEGMRFRTCYATPICSPTRMMIMTGRYGFRTGWYNFIGRQYAPEPDSPQFDIGAAELTLADVLKSAGYATGMTGKWQLPGSPEQRIFDCGFDEYCAWMWLHDLPGNVRHTGRMQAGRGRLPDRFWHPGIILNAQYRPTTPDDYGPNLFTDFAIDFIRRHRDQPFCLYYPMALTHKPWDPTPDPNRPGQKRPKGLKSNVEYMDHLIGRIVRAVDDLGLAERTYICFTGDNGTAGSGKASATELGARVPLIIRWPGHVPAGVVSDELSDLTDVLPTLAELAGVPLPADRVIDGVSLVPTLLGRAGPKRDWIFSYIGDRRVLRDKRWLLEGEDGWRFFDCGSSRDGSGYRDVTDSTAPEVLAARARFDTLLSALPGPESN